MAAAPAAPALLLTASGVFEGCQRKSFCVLTQPGHLSQEQPLQIIHVCFFQG